FLHGQNPNCLHLGGAATKRMSCHGNGAPMKIAQVSPLYESVPPKLYGGTERVVSNLTEELVRLGHQVTLFASGDSITAAELVPVTSAALRLDTNCRDTFVHHVLQQQEVLDRLPDFDVIHYHTDYFHFPMSAHHR